MSGLALWLGVGALGGVAAVGRFLIGGLFSALAPGRFPLGTLAVNLSGTLVLGVLLGIGLHGDAYLLAGTAAIGSYTTFSTWLFESQRLAEDGGRWIVALNLAGSLLLGVAAAALGRMIGGG